MISPVVFLFLATICLSAPAPDGSSVMDLLLRARQDRVSTIVKAIQASGLADTLQKGRNCIDPSISVVYHFKFVHDRWALHAVCSIKRRLQSLA